MYNYQYKKLNESFVYFEYLPPELLKSLIVEDHSKKFLPQFRDGYLSPDEYFYKIMQVDGKNVVIIPTGLLEHLNIYTKPPRNPDIFSKYSIIIDKISPFPPYDYQFDAVCDALYYKRIFIKAATGAGKSLIIGLIVKILTMLNLKGLILVPNISLTNQFDNDLKSYNLNIDTHLIGGENKIKHFDKPLTISTWQSVRLFKEKLNELDFIIVDEAHTVRGSEIFDICNRATNAEYKIGLSGTLPEDEVSRMKLKSVFGNPITYVTPRGLIDRGLATPVIINILDLKYKSLNIKRSDPYATQLKGLKECEHRTNLIVNLTHEVSLQGNTLVLFQHTQHGLDIFHKLLIKRKILFNNKTCKNLNEQHNNNIFFINGMIEGDQREQIRNIIEGVPDADIIEIEDTNGKIYTYKRSDCVNTGECMKKANDLTEDDKIEGVSINKIIKKGGAIIIASYPTMSTGVNIKNLHNMILASPLKSYITITQSIGRGIRLNKNKDIFNLYDIADNIGIFKKHIDERINKSYAPEGYDIYRCNIDII